MTAQALHVRGRRMICIIQSHDVQCTNSMSMIVSYTLASVYVLTGTSPKAPGAVMTDGGLVARHNVLPGTP